MNDLNENCKKIANLYFIYPQTCGLSLNKHECKASQNTPAFVLQLSFCLTTFWMTTKIFGSPFFYVPKCFMIFFRQFQDD